MNFNFVIPFSNFFWLPITVFNLTITLFLRTCDTTPCSFIAVYCLFFSPFDYLYSPTVFKFYNHSLFTPRDICPCSCITDYCLFFSPFDGLYSPRIFVLELGRVTAFTSAFPYISVHRYSTVVLPLPPYFVLVFIPTELGPLYLM